MGFVLGCENKGRYDFKALRLVKLIWDTMKNILYGDQDVVTSGCSCSCPLTGDLTSSACIHVYGWVVKWCKRYTCSSNLSILLL